MNCEQARNLFDAYLDGELSQALQTELGAHRVACDTCRHELALLEVAGDVMSADLDSEHKLGTAFSDRLLECVNLPERRSRRPWVFNRWLTGSMLAAAATIAFASVIWVTNPGGRVAGIKITAEPIDEKEFDRTTESIVNQFESTWNGRARDAETVVDFGGLLLTRMLNRVGSGPDAGDSAPPTGEEVAPDTAPDVAEAPETP